MDPITEQAPAWPTIFGFEDVPAKLANGSDILVRVRIVCARQAIYLLGIYENTTEVLRYVCEPIGACPADWIDCLHKDSRKALAEKARSLNFPVILAEFDEQLNAAEEMAKTVPTLQRANALKSSLTTAS
jgi:hypothetical protein